MKTFFENGMGDPREAGPRCGFTLVELLAVIAIIGTLVGLLLPAVQAARESARTTACANKLRQFALGVIGYESVRNSYPIGSFNPRYHQYWGCILDTLPFFEEQTVFDKLVAYSNSSLLNGAVPWNHLAQSTYLPVLRCPSELVPVPDLHAAGEPTNYHPSYGDIPISTSPSPRGPIGPYRDFGSSKSVTDGLSKTILVGEVSVYFNTTTIRGGYLTVAGLAGTSQPVTCLQALGSPTWNTAVNGGPGTRWADAQTLGFQTVLPPNAPVCGGWHPAASSYHPGGAQVAMCDGSTRFVGETIDTGNLTLSLTNATFWDGWGNPARPFRGPSPWGGVWQAMGSRSGGEVFQE